jgi:Tol biopolymer transport system component
VFGATEFWDAAWSPSGDRVAFVHDDTELRDDSSRTELRVRDVATGTERSLVNAIGPEWLEVIEFSPDGDRILFSIVRRGTGVGSLWSINADGSDARRLVARIQWADWRPQSPTP